MHRMRIGQHGTRIKPIIKLLVKKALLIIRYVFFFFSASGHVSLKSIAHFWYISQYITHFNIWFYKWANLKNCTKLHCEFHKWIKIITFLCALKKITILFQLNGITDFVISSFKRAEPTSTHCTHEMCQWHKQPVPFDSLCRAYLIAVQCQFLLTLAEKYFNRPSTHIPGKNLLCR